MRISKKTRYGFKALLYLSLIFSEKRVASLKEISEKQDIPFDFLEKIISVTRKAGLVKAKKGIRGGYLLARPPEKITMAEIVRVLEKSPLLTDCNECKKEKNCLAGKAWKKVQESLSKTLRSITLKNLIK